MKGPHELTKEQFELIRRLPPREQGKVDPNVDDHKLLNHGVKKGFSTKFSHASAVL